jgi:uncharacterized protein YggE
MKRTVLPVLSAAVVLAAAVFAYDAGRGPRTAVAADVPVGSSGVVVDGLGKVTGTPDVLRATLGVSVHGAQVSNTLAKANDLQRRVAAALAHSGVAAKDLQTSDVRIDQDYNNKGRPDGYRVTETLTAKLRNLAKAGQALTDAVTVGGNDAQLQGVSFDLEDNVALQGAARDQAFADAKAKAQRYAELSGRTLGDVQLISESTAPLAPVAFGLAASAGRGTAADSPVPISAGSQEVSVSVTVRWSLK